jgi:hypothetical protein
MDTRDRAALAYPLPPLAAPGTAPSTPPATLRVQVPGATFAKTAANATADPKAAGGGFGARPALPILGAKL